MHLSLKKLSLVIFISDAILCSGVGRAQMRCPADAGPGNLAAQFRIGGSSIQMPVGAFLLVRKNGQVGAIRLTSVDPTATEEYGKSSYESYFSGGGSSLFNAATAIHQTGAIDIRPFKGPGRGLWIYEPGPHRASVGNKWAFSFVAPDMMWMAPYHSGPNKDYEFAPTSACNLSEIDALDKRLRWFRFDPNAVVVLPLADLPK